MKTERKLFTSLTRSYILFGLTVILLNAALGYLLGDVLALGKAPELTAGKLVRPDYRSIPYDQVKAAGGSARVLDENRRVIYSTEAAGGNEAYSAEELLRLLEDRSGSAYISTLAPFRTDSGQALSLLLTMPKQGNYVHIYVNTAMLLLFLLAVYGFSRWTARRITGPLELIVQAIRKMRDGQYGERLFYRSDYELTVIQEHFNRMATTLERTEQEKQELERIKQRMLLDLSHDLLTPITTIQGYAKALQLGMADSPEKQREYLDIIHNKSLVVTSLIEDIFQLATLESPDFPLTKETGDLAELLRRIAIEYYDVLRHRGLDMEICIPDGEVRLRMNRKLLHRAIANLISNALQHNKEGTKVSLLLEETAGTARIQVCDDGIGIPEELRGMLFQPFMRGDPSRRSGGGTGLGLAIARRAVELHGGSLRLLDEPGMTVFEIVLPKGEAV